MEMKPSGDVIIARFTLSQWAVKHKTSLSTLINCKGVSLFTKLFIGSFKAVVIITLVKRELPISLENSGLPEAFNNFDSCWFRDPRKVVPEYSRSTMEPS